MAALTRTGKKERNERLLGVLILGAIISLSTTYLLAPRFQEPVRVAEEANSSLGSKILINESLSLLSAQQEKQGLAKEELMELQKKFPRETEVSTLEQAINFAIGEVGLTSNALQTLTFQTEFVPIANPRGAVDPAVAGGVEAPAEGTEGNPLPQASMYSKAFDMTIAGNSRSLVLLVDKLLNMERVIVIDSMNISFDPQNNISLLTIRARAFLMPNTIDPAKDVADLENVDSLGNPDALAPGTPEGTPTEQEVAP